MRTVWEWLKKVVLFSCVLVLLVMHFEDYKYFDRGAERHVAALLATILIVFLYHKIARRLNL